MLLLALEMEDDFRLFCVCVLWRGAGVMCDVCALISCSHLSLFAGLFFFFSHLLFFSGSTDGRVGGKTKTSATNAV